MHLNTDVKPKLVTTKFYPSSKYAWDETRIVTARQLDEVGSDSIGVAAADRMAHWVAPHRGVSFTSTIFKHSSHHRVGLMAER